MDPSQRNTSALIGKATVSMDGITVTNFRPARIDRIRDEMVKRFQNIVGYAAIEKSDRNTTATIQYQMQVETAAYIKAGRDLQTLIRELQEIWLFGQDRTVEGGNVIEGSDETVKKVVSLVRQLESKHNDGIVESDAMQTGD